MQGAGSAHMSGMRKIALCQQGTEVEMWILCYLVWPIASLAASRHSTTDKAIQVIDISILRLCKLLVGIWLRKFW